MIVQKVYATKVLCSFILLYIIMLAAQPQLLGRVDIVFLPYSCGQGTWAKEVAGCLSEACFQWINITYLRMPSERQFGLPPEQLVKEWNIGTQKPLLMPACMDIPGMAPEASKASKGICMLWLSLPMPSGHEWEFPIWNACDVTWRHNICLLKLPHTCCGCPLLCQSML